MTGKKCASAKRRLADEYDAAQERGEVANNGGKRGNQFASVPRENTATAADIGLSRKDIHEARIIRDAENVDPGIVRRSAGAGIGIFGDARKPGPASPLHAQCHQKNKGGGS